MKLLTFALDGAEQVGVLSADGAKVLPLQALGFPWESMQSLIEEADPQALAALRAAVAAAPVDMGYPYDRGRSVRPFPGCAGT